MTAIADAMLRSGLEVAPSRLHAAAVRALQSCNCDPARAIGRFQEIVDNDLALRREIAMDYLRQRLAEMQGDRTELRGGAHGAFGGDTRSTLGAVSHPKVVAVDRCERGQEPRVLLSTATTPIRSDVQMVDGRKPRCAGGVAPKPNPPRAVSARLASRVETAKTVLDTFQVRDGRAIGDLQWHELLRLVGTNEREARVLRYVADHVANAPSHAKVREVIKPSVLIAAIKHAEAINADAA